MTQTFTARRRLHSICDSVPTVDQVMVNNLRAAVIWANSYNKFDAASPFGGYKESGFGREGGAQGLSSYVRLS